MPREPKVRNMETALAFVNGIELARILLALYQGGEPKAAQECEALKLWDWQTPLVIAALQNIVEDTFQIFDTATVGALEDKLRYLPAPKEHL